MTAILSFDWFINCHFFSASIEKFFIVYALEDGDEKRIADDELEVVVDDGGVATVGCVASINSGSVEPQLDVAVDDESRTADAILSKSVTSETSDDDLVLYNTRVKLSLGLGRVGRAESGKRIRCTARAKGYDDRTLSAVLKVRCECLSVFYVESVLTVGLSSSGSYDRSFLIRCRCPCKYVSM